MSHLTYVYKAAAVFYLFGFCVFLRRNIRCCGFLDINPVIHFHKSDRYFCHITAAGTSEYRTEESVGIFPFLLTLCIHTTIGTYIYKLFFIHKRIFEVAYRVRLESQLSIKFRTARSYIILKFVKIKHLSETLGTELTVIKCTMMRIKP